MKKIGVFGGTFDPIHLGHIHLALSLKEHFSLDEVIFSPNNQNPLGEKNAPVASAKMRFEMVKSALEGIDGLSITDYEILRPAPSFTIDLIQYIQQTICHKEDKLFLLLAEDLIENLLKWKDVEKLFAIAAPLVGSRNKEACKKETSLDPDLQKLIEKGRVTIPTLEISSSLIRERLKNKLYCGHLVPYKTIDYIYINKLYSKR